MAELDQLVSTLKRHLKSQGYTYRRLGEVLKLSEPSVKRMFASRRMGVDRLIEISNLLGFTLAELAQEAVVGENQLQLLSEAQERELVSEIPLLLVAVCALNHWEMADIVHVYQMSEHECIRLLVRLDRLRLIHFLPGNRIRLNVTRNFDWLPDGPIRSFFRQKGLPDFLRGDFAGADEVLAFSHGMLSADALTRMHAEIRKLRQRFAELHQESLETPLARRQGTGLLLAMRGWELAAFGNLRRTAT
ncbi:helix-turn-helix transcriptional regulator [Silvimonas sp. JCM 19000]